MLSKVANKLRKWGFNNKWTKLKNWLYHDLKIHRHNRGIFDRWGQIASAQWRGGRQWRFSGVLESILIQTCVRPYLTGSACSFSKHPAKEEKVTCLCNATLKTNVLCHRVTGMKIWQFLVGHWLTPIKLSQMRAHTTRVL